MVKIKCEWRGQDGEGFPVVLEKCMDIDLWIEQAHAIVCSAHLLHSFEIVLTDELSVDEAVASVRGGEGMYDNDAFVEPGQIDCIAPLVLCGAIQLECGIRLCE